jgi:hypothetical protein
MPCHAHRFSGLPLLNLPNFSGLLDVANFHAAQSIKMQKAKFGCNQV